MKKMKAPSLNGLYDPIANRTDAEKAQIEVAMKKQQADIKVYEEKYGPDGLLKYLEDEGIMVDFDGTYDYEMKQINSCIFHGAGPLHFDFTGDEGRKYVCNWMIKWNARLMELFGDNSSRVIYHKANDEKVNQLLLDNAVKTGKWKELPDALQKQYHRLVGA